MNINKEKTMLRKIGLIESKPHPFLSKAPKNAAIKGASDNCRGCECAGCGGCTGCGE